jgi:hypothetical protein
VNVFTGEDIEKAEKTEKNSWLRKKRNKNHDENTNIVVQIMTKLQIKPTFFSKIQW